VCGGSKGIGRATAAEIVRMGGSVHLVARGREALDGAVAGLTDLVCCEGQSIGSVACDTTDPDAFGAVAAEYVQRHGSPDYLLNVVGSASPAYIESLFLEDFRAAMEVNYFGQLVPTLAFLPHMIEAGGGHIAVVSSVLGYMGAMGYATYAPTKYALVGLVESLRHELKSRGIRFSVLFPPDTDTPGFAIENETKPEEWSVSGAAKLSSAEEVGRAFADGLAKGRFYIVPGQSWLLWRLARFTPRIIHTVADRELKSARRELGKV